MRIKKVLFAVLIASVLTGCGTGQNVPQQNSSSLSESSIAESVPASDMTSDEDESSIVEESSDVEATSATENTELSETLAKYMKDSFGGGDAHPEFATSWYKYIDTITVLEDSGVYRVEVKVTDSPADAVLRGYTSMYSLGDAYDTFIETIIDTQYALKLEDLDGCLIADSLYKILTKDSNVGIYYSSLFAYGIDVYKYISDATNGQYSESYVLQNSDYLCGADFVNAVLIGMQNEFGDSCTEFMLYDADRIAYAIKANFKEVSISQVDIINPEGTVVDTVK